MRWHSEGIAYESVVDVAASNQVIGSGGGRAINSAEI
jgi:hypothetical protein